MKKSLLAVRKGRTVAQADRVPREAKNEVASILGESTKEIKINLENLKSEIVKPHAIGRRHI